MADYADVCRAKLLAGVYDKQPPPPKVAPAPVAGKCARCGDPFETSSRTAQYCSDFCKNRAAKARARARHRED